MVVVSVDSDEKEGGTEEVTSGGLESKEEEEEEDKKEEEKTEEEDKIVEEKDSTVKETNTETNTETERVEGERPWKCLPFDCDNLGEGHCHLCFKVRGDGTAMLFINAA